MMPKTKRRQVREAEYRKAPFPWFGGKRHAASLVWSLLGDPVHYIEPFFGSGAVLLRRPHPCNRTYYSETVNDIDGLLVNAWRAIQWHPEETAHHASWPVSELDKTARQIAVLQWREEKRQEILAGSPEYCDPRIAGWWLWVVCAQIGPVNGEGPWTADPVSGRIVQKTQNQANQPGVSRSRPHLSNNGQGVTASQLREPGVWRGKPHISDNGSGVNAPQLREPGVFALAGEFHPITMPELVRWFQWLAARLRHVRILCGDWARLCTTGAAWTLSVREGRGPAGVFLDPPYSRKVGRDVGLYLEDSLGVSEEVEEWCLKWGDNPKFRIVLAGFEGEHDTKLQSAGWTEYKWFNDGYLTGGMGQTKHTDSDAVGGQQHRERLWASPGCLRPSKERLLFDDSD